MKQFIKTFAAAVCLVAGAPHLTSAQNNYVDHSPRVIAAVSEKENTREIETTVNTMVSTRFAALYPEATAMKWSETSTNSYVSFLHKGRRANACFSAKGKLSYVLTTCDLNQLPAHFSKTIREEYAGYVLKYGTEIKAYGETAYQAILENPSGFITLRCTVDGVEEIQSVKK